MCSGIPPDTEVAYGYRYLWTRFAEPLDCNVCAEAVAPMLDGVPTKLGNSHIAGVTKRRYICVLVLNDLPSSRSDLLN